MSAVTLRAAASGASDVPVKRIAVGLMGLTWRDEPIADDMAFEAIKAALDTVSGAEKLVLNSASFYGPKTNPAANVELIARFFKKHPELREKAFIAIKSGLGFTATGPKPDASVEHLRKDIGNVLSKLDGVKLDCFVMGRQDITMPIETAVKNMKTVADEGLFTHIAISESSADTIRRASKVIPLAFHEMEYSPISLEIEEIGIVDACAENQVPILAYSPTGRGLLTGAIKSIDDIPQGDIRRAYDRFQPDNFSKNLKLYEHFQEIANRKKCTTSQLSIAWVARQKGHVIPLTGSTRASGIRENLESANVQLTDADLEDMRKVIAAATPAGSRGAGHGRHLMAADTPALEA